MTDFSGDEPYYYQGQKLFGLFVLSSTEEKARNLLFRSRDKAKEFLESHKGQYSAVIHEFELRDL